MPVLRRSSVFIAAIAIAAVAGVVLRVLSLRGGFGASDSDEAIWTLMSRHVLDGEFPVYFWGQGYGGTIEVYLAAPFVWAFGGGVGAARAVALLLTCVATALVWVVGRRALDVRRASVAAALFWVWPAYAAWKSTRVNGFYVSGQILALLAILLILRLAESPRNRDALVLGVVTGLAAWQTLQVVPVLVPALLWLAWRRPGAYRLIWLAVPGVSLGALPAIVVNVRNGWWFHWLAPGGGTYPSRFHGFFTAALSQALGLRVPFSLDWLVPSPLGLLLVAGAVAGAAFLLYRHRRDDIGLLAAIALGFPFLYALSPYTWYVTEPRYLLVLSPVIALLVSAPLGSARAAAAVLVGAVALSLVGFAAMGRGTAFESRNGNVTMPADIEPIVTALEQRGITRAVSEYWLSYRIILATKEHVILGNDSDDHYAPFRDAVAAAGPDVAHVYVAGSPDERAAARRLVAERYKRELFGGFSLWTRP